MRFSKHKNFVFSNLVFSNLLEIKKKKLDNFFFSKKKNYLVKSSNTSNKFKFITIFNSNQIFNITKIRNKALTLTFFFKNLYTLLQKYKIFFLKIDELELKGINYRFSKLKSNLLLDLGCSHFQLFYYPAAYFFLSLKKKKSK